MAALGPRFTDALAYATQLHANQVRKGTEIPYVSHLLGVASLVIEAGGDEDQAIAALLHDAVEDQGGAPTLAEIKKRYGERVARIVDGCTDTDQHPKPPWRARKEAYLRHLPTAGPDVLRVSLADKLYNARAVLADLRVLGDRLWTRFTGGKEGELYYYRALAGIFNAALPGPQASELERVVTEIEALAKRGDEAG